jgi:hypothetical protein
MDTPKAIIIASVILGGSILVSQGMYDFSSSQMGVAHRYNRITGSVALCVHNMGCDIFQKKKSLLEELNEINKSNSQR